MTTNNKILTTLLTASVIIGISMLQPTGKKGLYGNKVGTYLATEQNQMLELNWLKRNDFNSYCGYGVESYITTNPSKVRSFVYSLRKNGFKEVGLIYSRSSSVTVSLDQYNRNCTNDSMKFNFVVSEIEQYNTSDRIGFYNNIRTVSTYCTKNKIRRYVYQGWPSTADIDSIVKYTDGIYLHAYGVYSNYTNVGAWVYGYTKGRLANFATAAAKYQKPYSVTIIYSCENPDTTKTQFGAKYFQTHGWQDAHNSFITYYNSNATTLMKTNLVMGGSQLFVEDQAKKIKP